MPESWSCPGCDGPAGDVVHEADDPGGVGLEENNEESRLVLDQSALVLEDEDPRRS